jgi:hypothetical protein
MSYNILGMSCKSKTIACTSNHKFLPLHSPEYLKHDTYMMQYPGNNSATSISHPLPKYDDADPKAVKFQYGGRYEQDNMNLENPRLIGKMCKNC